MKKKNVWVLTVFFGFILCYMLTTALLEEKLEEVAGKYVEDACTCFTESANVLFEYYKNAVDYIEIREFDSIRRNELSKITDEDLERYWEKLQVRTSSEPLELGAFFELVDGTFLATENQYITRDVLFNEEQIQVLNDLKKDIESLNTICVSKGVTYKNTQVCFIGKPIVNKYNEYIGYKAVICKLDLIEQFENEYLSEQITPEIRLSDAFGDVYVTKGFYKKLNSRDSISKTVLLPEENDYLTVCVSKNDVMNYFFIYIDISLVVWTFIIIFLCKEIFNKTLTINRRFAYISAGILLVIIGIELIIFDLTMTNLQNNSNNIQAYVCCYKDKCKTTFFNDLFIDLQKDLNANLHTTDYEGYLSDYIVKEYGELCERFLRDEKYAAYVYIVDKDGHKTAVHKGFPLEFDLNSTWFNYNQYLYNSNYIDFLTMPDLDQTFVVLGLPIAFDKEVQSIICFVYNLEGYVDDLYSFLSSTNNDKILIDSKGTGTLLGNNAIVPIEPYEAKGTKPYLSFSDVGQYRLIQFIKYKYNSDIDDYLVYDSYFAQRRVVFLRDGEGRTQIELVVLLITILTETILGICTHLFNRNVINYSRVDEGTKLAIQEKLKTFKE